MTRHPALVDLLRERGIVGEDVPVLSHVTEADVRGRVVAGVLPLHLAAAAEAVVEVPLALAPEDRGRELGLDRLREIAGPVRVYRVHAVDPEEVLA